MKCKNCGSKRNVNKIDGVQICMICNAEKTIRSADDKLIDMLAELMDREEERRKNDSLALERAEDLYRYALEEDSTFALAYAGLARVYWGKHYWETYFSDDFLDSVFILTEIVHY